MEKEKSILIMRILDSIFKELEKLNTDTAHIANDIEDILSSLLRNKKMSTDEYFVYHNIAASKGLSSLLDKLENQRLIIEELNKEDDDDSILKLIDTLLKKVEEVSKNKEILIFVKNYLNTLVNSIDKEDTKVKKLS